MNKGYLLVLLLWLSPLCAWSQDGSIPEPVPQLSTDKTEVVTKEFDKDLSQEYTGGDFDYDQVRGESENFLKRFVNWFFNTLEDLFGIEVDPDLYGLVETLLYIILISVGLFLMVRLLMGQQATSFFRGKSRALAPLTVQEEQLAQTDFDALINDALSQNDYRLAVRYKYLKTLRQLSLKNIIDWHFEKTNSDYVREIKADEIKQGFSKVSYLYEYIWYGEFAIDADGYHKADSSFNSFLKTIKRHG
ncbi:MAG: hypothetical protein ABJM06_02455 [Gilvibacter sp.]